MYKSTFEYLESVRAPEGVVLTFEKVSCEEIGLRLIGVYDFDELNVIAFSPRKKAVYSSRDQGESWEEVFALSDLSLPKSCEVVRAIYSPSGWYIFQTIKPFKTIIYSDEYSTSKVVDVGAFPWHGSQGAAISPSGVAMFAEYQTGFEDEKPELSVWRSEPPYEEWSKALTQVSGRWPEGDIRHFHTCIFDPYDPSVWYVSSGDLANHNRVWVSIDDGVEFKEILIEKSNASDYRVKDERRLLRYTSLSFSKQGVTWGTDDSLGIKSSVVVTSDRGAMFREVRLLDTICTNLIRSAIRVNEALTLMISESKDDVEFIDLCLVSQDGRVVSLFKFTNLERISSPVTASISSSKFVNGCAFVPSMGRFLTKDRNSLLRIRVSEHD